MSTLHLIRQSAFATNDFEQCLSLLSDSDTVVLMDDGCYNLKHPSLLKQLNRQACNANLKLMVIKSHRKARAIELLEGVDEINMAEVISLTFSNQQVITWQ